MISERRGRGRPRKDTSQQRQKRDRPGMPMGHQLERRRNDLPGDDPRMDADYTCAMCGLEYKGREMHQRKRTASQPSYITCHCRSCGNYLVHLRQLRFKRRREASAAISGVAETLEGEADDEM